MLQVQGYVRLSHLFSHCSAAASLWHYLCGIFNECWVCSSSFDQLSVSFHSFGRRKETKLLWQCTICSTTWCIWSERNYHIFSEISVTYDSIWNKIWRLASIWCKAHGLFTEVSTKGILRVWKALLRYFFFLFSFFSLCFCSFLASED